MNKGIEFVCELTVYGNYKPVDELVRCKDCKYGQYCTDGETTYQCYKWNSNEFGALHEQDWFCADGERKSD